MSRWFRTLLVVLGVYLLAAYVVLPVFWEHHEHNPALRAVPKITHTGDGLPGDPLNVSLVGTQDEVLAAFAAAGWRRPAPIDIRSSLGIAASVVLDRPDPTAPVSNLYLFDRKEDLAFEQEVGTSARHRNHVRFWRSEEMVDGRPLWLGAATFDRGVGLSHRTGQVTHHIGPDIDAERDQVIADLSKTGWLSAVYQVTGIGPTVNGRNGGGDWFFSDGEMDVGILRHVDAGAVGAPAVLPNPAPIAIKNQVFAWLRPMLRAWDSEPPPAAVRDPGR